MWRLLPRSQPRGLKGCRNADAFFRSSPQIPRRRNSWWWTCAPPSSSCAATTGSWPQRCRGWRRRQQPGTCQRCGGCITSWCRTRWRRGSRPQRRPAASSSSGSSSSSSGAKCRACGGPALAAGCAGWPLRPAAARPGPLQALPPWKEAGAPAAAPWQLQRTWAAPSRVRGTAQLCSLSPRRPAVATLPTAPGALPALAGQGCRRCQRCHSTP
jgi:hypothetical protein